MANTQDLINQINGKVITVTGGDAGQCTAVPHYWEQMLGLGIVYGNAKDTFANASDGDYVKITNSPDNFPLEGAIIVYGAAWGGGYGHTGVALAGCTSSKLRILEQNNPTGAAVKVSERGYSGVMGWFYPRKLTAQVNQGGSDVSKVDISTAQKIANAMAGRDPSDPNNLADLQAHHVGAETNSDLQIWWDSDEHREYAGRVAAAFEAAGHANDLATANTDLQTKLSDADTQIQQLADANKELTAKVAVTSNDTQTLNNFGKALLALLVRLGLKSN